MLLEIAKLPTAENSAIHLNSTDNVAVTGYQIYRNNKLLTRTSGATTNFSDTTVSPSAVYTYEARACDWAGNVSSNSNSISVTSLASDAQGPTVASNLTAQAISPTQIRVRWRKSSDNRRVTAYDLYRDSRLRTRLPAGTTNFVDGTVLPMTTYTFFVRARDGDGNVSGPSNSASATTPPAPE